jgi:hypothetical protein
VMARPVNIRRALVTQPANEIAGALISMMARSP